MAGKAKRKYNGESTCIAKTFTRPLNLVVETLKPGYTKEDLLNAFKKYYPFEWKELEERQIEYRKKDQFLRKKQRRTRYNPISAEQFFYGLPKIKYLLSRGYCAKHQRAYNEEERCAKEQQLKEKRENRINRRESAITTYMAGSQKVDPGFIDAMIFAYHDRNNGVNEKLEIFKETQKYDCTKCTQFFTS